MTRIAASLLMTATLVTACAGPIKTRVQTISYVERVQVSEYTFSKDNSPNSQISKLVKQNLEQVLESKGLRKSDDSPHLLDFSVADRPASVSIHLGEDGKRQVAVSSKENKPFQSCKDREHRLIISLLHKNSGNQLYRGTASEYHCKASLQQSIPHLVKAALSNFGLDASGVPQNKALIRHGLE